MKLNWVFLPFCILAFTSAYSVDNKCSCCSVWSRLVEALRNRSVDRSTSIEMTCVPSGSLFLGGSTFVPQLQNTSEGRSLEKERLMPRSGSLKNITKRKPPTPPIPPSRPYANTDSETVMGKLTRL